MLTIETQEEGIKSFEGRDFPVSIVPRIIKRDPILYAELKAEFCSVGFKVNEVSYALAHETAIKPIVYFDDGMPHPVAH